MIDEYNFSFNEKDSNSIFLIQMPYGEVKPRLLCNKENPYLFTKLISSTRRWAQAPGLRLLRSSDEPS